MAQDGCPLSPIVVKKYANRRLYDTESSIYITLDTLADMVRQGRDFVVYDAKTGDDITRAVLTQVIMEEEIRGRNMLPTAFLRQLISFYGHSVQGLVPDYLERMMEQFAPQHIQTCASMQQTAMTGCSTVSIDHAASAMRPYYRNGYEAIRPERTTNGTVEIHHENDEVLALRAEVAKLRLELARLAGLTDGGMAESIVPTGVGDIRH